LLRASARGVPRVTETAMRGKTPLFFDVGSFLFRFHFLPLIFFFFVQ
jgi:hypothetical protein